MPKVGDYLKANPNATKAEIIKQVAANRDQIRQRLVNFLNPEQLKKWDAEVTKAKESLGQQIAACALGSSSRWQSLESPATETFLRWIDKHPRPSLHCDTSVWSTT
jgi:hypothetical protein